MRSRCHSRPRSSLNPEREASRALFVPVIVDITSELETRGVSSIPLSDALRCAGSSTRAGAGASARAGAGASPTDTSTVVISTSSRACTGLSSADERRANTRSRVGAGS